MSNYVQMRTCLRDHGRVLALAKATKKHPLFIVGCLHAVWSLDVEYGRTVGDDVRVDGYGPEQIDNRTFDGFAASLERMGWVRFDDDGLIMPNARKYQKDVRKIREKWRNDKRRKEAKADDASAKTSTENSARNSTENSIENSERILSVDKIRQDKTIPEYQNPPTPLAAKAAKRERGEDVPIPPELTGPAFAEAWTRWLAARKARRKPVSATAAEQQLTTLAKHGPQAAIAAIERSIANDWTGLFPEQDHGGRVAGSRAAGIRDARIATEYAEAPTPLPMFDLAQNASNANGNEGGSDGVHAPAC